MEKCFPRRFQMNSEKISENSSRIPAVFLLLGQSNAVGHGVPMREEDRITVPMKNVFGLHRSLNQSFDSDQLHWSGYESGGMNLAEEQDHTYSVANQLAIRWQAHIDSGNEWELPDLYILQIAIGAQVVSEGYMWNPAYPERMVPGRLGTVDISLFRFACHIFSLLSDSFPRKKAEIIGLHWRGGENDVSAPSEGLFSNLLDTYREIFDAFNRILEEPPLILHRIIARDRMFDLDPSGEWSRRMDVINAVFEELAKIYPNASVFDVRSAPQYLPDVRGNGVFIKDVVHYTPEVNAYVAEEVIRQYVAAHRSESVLPNP